MKRILMAAALALAAGGQALAADLPQPAPPPPRAPATYVPVPVPVFSWTGIYVGINGGYAFGTSSWNAQASARPATSAPTACSSAARSAAITSGASSCSASRAMATGRTSMARRPHLWPGCEAKSDWLATVRGRAGYAFDRILVYGTGGGAFGNVQAASRRAPFSSATQIGWTAGGGVEFAFTPNLTAKVEYLYVDLGSQSCALAICARRQCH